MDVPPGHVFVGRARPYHLVGHYVNAQDVEAFSSSIMTKGTIAGTIAPR
jgi:hypothetical protein